MIRIRVRCSYVLDLALPDDYAADDDMLRFRIEENGCPGTGEPGAALERIMSEAGARSICWACGQNGENKILEIVRT